MTEFMKTLHESFVEDEYTEKTANNHINALKNLNGKKPFDSLDFLGNKELVDERLSKYALSTQTSTLNSAIAALRPHKKDATLGPLYTHYKKCYDEKVATRKADTATHEPSEKQKEAYIPWADVLKKAEELWDGVKATKGTRVLPSVYDSLLNAMLLGVYTDLEPRRNQDYSQMFVVKKWNDTLPKDKNYVDLETHRFVFNKYKTAKNYGAQVIAIPDSLFVKVLLYLKHHPTWRGQKKNSKELVPFLVNHNGEHLAGDNCITRLLNNIFEKNIGATMLRHIYLSEKHGDKIVEMQSTANAMAHTPGVALDYVKKF